jgi:hypothetical protein
MGFFSWFGRRNVAYVIFLALLVLDAVTNNDNDPAGRGGEAGLIMLLWIVVTLVFGGANFVLMFVALAKRRPAGKPIIACVLSLLSVIVVPASA